jgi:hypothetical protein
MSMMFTAKVKDGRLVVDPVVELPEGATVTVLLKDDVDHVNDADRDPTSAEEAEIDDAIAEADRVGWIPSEQVIAELRRR